MAITDVANPPKPTLIERQALAVPVRPVIAEAEFLTRERDDLFSLSRRLMSSISPLALQDASKPVIVTVRGSFGKGKKIIPDAACKSMLGPAPRYNGRDDDYELWRGIHNGKDFEIDFLNYQHIVMFLIHRVKWDDVGKWDFESARAEFLSLRQHGGITFLHNDEATAKFHADIDIRIEHSCFHALTYVPERTNLTSAFNLLSLRHRWARHVTIEVKNEELMRHEPFAREIELLQPPAGMINTSFSLATKLMASIIPSTATKLLVRDNIPIYGVNIAPP